MASTARSMDWTRLGYVERDLFAELGPALSLDPATKRFESVILSLAQSLLWAIIGM